MLEVRLSGKFANNRPTNFMCPCTVPFDMVRLRDKVSLEKYYSWRIMEGSHAIITGLTYYPAKSKVADLDFERIT